MPIPDTKLKQFMDKVLAINPRYGALDANGIPAMGQPNVGANTVERLRHSAAEFAKAYLANQTDFQVVVTKAQAVEAALQLVATMSVTPGKTIEPLFADLDELVNQKNRNVKEA